ncbi:MAG TPA: MlaD family protein [Stellaceae bacterium]|nr:MlaD family protein [Stellaceae bacterium]
METRANYVVVGTFVLVLLLGAFVSILWLARVEFTRTFAYYDVYFSGSVTGLNEGAPVRYSGVQIGRVSDIRLDPQNPEQVRVTLEVDSTTEIKSDAVASLETTGITGVAYVEISGGSREAPVLQRQADQRFPVIASRPSQLQTVFASAPEVLNRLIVVADRLAELLDDKNRAAISASLDNIQQLTASGVQDANKLGGVIDDSDFAVKQFRTTMSSANDTVIELQKTLVLANGAALDLSAALKQFDVTAQHLDALVQENRPPLKDFTRTGLTELNQLISDTRVLVGSLTRIAGELERDPSRFLFGDRGSGYKPK